MSPFSPWSDVSQLSFEINDHRLLCFLYRVREWSERKIAKRGEKRRVVKALFETFSISKDIFCFFLHRSISLFAIPSLLPIQSLMIGRHSSLHSKLPCISLWNIFLCPHYFFFYPSLYLSLLLSSASSFCLFNLLMFYRTSPCHLLFSTYHLCMT